MGRPAVKSTYTLRAQLRQNATIKHARPYRPRFPVSAYSACILIVVSHIHATPAFPCIVRSCSVVPLFVYLSLPFSCLECNTLPLFSKSVRLSVRVGSRAPESNRPDPIRYPRFFYLVRLPLGTTLLYSHLALHCALYWEKNKRRNAQTSIAWGLSECSILVNGLRDDLIEGKTPIRGRIKCGIVM